MPETTPPRRVPARLRTLLRASAGMLLGTFVVVVVLEGLASVVYFVGRLYRDRAIAEQRHTRYDPDLGWVNIPRLELPHMYGPGISLTTNSQGFRGARDYARAVPEGRRRLICSGDSFTLGYGVDDEHTWCRQLESLDPRLETVNMGQGGYGIDQAYLWYRRDAADLDHQLHLFAFVTEDFIRALSDRFFGFGKPLLVLRDGKLAVTNVPVPRPNPLGRWITAHTPHLRNLATIRLAVAVRSEIWGDPRIEPVDGPEELALASAILGELAALDRARGRRLALVYLPTREDYRSGAAEPWRKLVEARAGELGLPFIDLIPTLRSLPPEAIDPLFIQVPAVGYLGAAGHYTDQGNRWAAEEISARLAEWRSAPMLAPRSTP